MTPEERKETKKEIERLNREADFTQFQLENSRWDNMAPEEKFEKKILEHMNPEQMDDP